MPQTITVPLDQLQAAPPPPQAATTITVPLADLQPHYQTANEKDAQGNAVVDPNPFDAVRGRSLADLDAQRTAAGADVLKGVAKSALGTVEGGGKLVRALPGVGPVLAAGPSVAAPFSAQPSNTTQAVSKMAGDIGQFFLPTSALGKAKAAVATGHGILDALIGAGLEGASAAGISSVQKGTTAGAGQTAALTAGTTIGAQVAFKAMRPLAEKIEDALVKSSTADFKNGFRVANIFKYKLGGTLSQTYDKAEAKINDLSRDLRAALATAKPGAAPTVDVLQAIADTSADLTRGGAKTFGANADIGRAVDKLVNDPMFQTIAPHGAVDLATANQVKQAIGDLGAWLHDPSGRVVRDPESKGMEVVANALYSKLNQIIAQQAGGPYGAINRQLSEVLPIRQAIIRRIPIEQRANVLSLGDLLSFSSGTWGLALANRVLKSGQTANMLSSASQVAAPVAAAAGRTAGAVSSQVPR